MCNPLAYPIPVVSILVVNLISGPKAMFSTSLGTQLDSQHLAERSDLTPLKRWVLMIDTILCLRRIVAGNSVFSRFRILSLDSPLFDTVLS